MFSSGLLTKGFIGLISIASAGGGIGSGLGSVFGNNSQPKTELVDKTESPEKGLSSEVNLRIRENLEQKFQGDKKQKINSQDFSQYSEKNQETSQIKLLNNSEQTTSTSVEIEVKKSQVNNSSSSEEEQEEVVVREIRGENGFYCLHTWVKGVYQNGAFCFNPSR